MKSRLDPEKTTREGCASEDNGCDTSTGELSSPSMPEGQLFSVDFVDCFIRACILYLSMAASISVLVGMASAAGIMMRAQRPASAAVRIFYRSSDQAENEAAPLDLKVLICMLFEMHILYSTQQENTNLSRGSRGGDDRRRRQQKSELKALITSLFVSYYFSESSPDAINKTSLQHSYSQ